MRIWEEIEQRTMQLHLSQVPMQPQVSPIPVHPWHTSDDDDITPPKPTIGNTSNRDKRRRRNTGREDDMSVQVDDSDDVYRLQVLREAHESPYEGQFVPNTEQSPAERARLHVFLASDPPKLYATSSEENSHCTRHTSMKLSDVLNDDAGVQNGPAETAPLLASFSAEGSLTAEGKRQVYIFSIFQHKLATNTFRQWKLATSFAQGLTQCTTPILIPIGCLS